MSGRAEALALAMVALPYFQEQWERVPNNTTRARLDSALRTIELLEDEMKISEEAVEAVAKVLVEDGAYGVPWGDATADDQEELLRKARVIVAAAAPHLMAAAA